MFRTRVQPHVPRPMPQVIKELYHPPLTYRHRIMSEILKQFQDDTISAWWLLGDAIAFFVGSQRITGSVTDTTSSLPPIPHDNRG